MIKEHGCRMNQVIELLMNHRSIRTFKPDPIPDSTVETIVRAAQMASTSSNVQAYSVIAIKDRNLREQLMKLSGNQQYVMDCPVFLVWCADLYRLSKAAAKHAEVGGGEQQNGGSGQQMESSEQTGAGSSTQQAGAGHVKQDTYADSVENLLIATVDTALAAQNAAVAAESLGLGIVYIGGLRNQIAEVSELLNLPELVYPLFGMCIGIPDQAPLSRPRLPLDAVLHTDTYQTERIEPGIDAYDRIYSQYMRERSGGKDSTVWSIQMRKRLTEPIRLHMKDFLQSKGFMKR